MISRRSGKIMRRILRKIAAGTVTPEDNNDAAILAKLGGEQRRRQVIFGSGSVLIMRYPLLADPGIVSILIDSFAKLPGPTLTLCWLLGGGPQRQVSTHSLPFL